MVGLGGSYIYIGTYMYMGNCLMKRDDDGSEGGWMDGR